MRLNKISLLFVFFLLIGVGGAVLGIATDSAMTQKAFGCGLSGQFAGDLTVRHAEVTCAHLGVNSFHIWDRRIVIPGFCPMGRSDKPEYQAFLGDRCVHAYPPWHVFYYWFYGWLPKNICIGVMACVFGLCLAFVVHEVFEIAKTLTSHAGLCTVGVLAMISYFVVKCFIWQNYGVLNLALLFLMIRALRGDHQIMAGVLWSIAMTKPQVGTLFFWPLLFGRRYVTIVTAVGMCLLTTIVMGVNYHESPIDLLIQLPLIGAPYAKVMLTKILGPYGCWVQMLIVGSVCGFLCYGLRNAQKWYVRFAPAALCAPLWSYCLGHDMVSLAVWYCVVAYAIISHAEEKKRKWWIGFAIYGVFAYAFSMVWEFALLSDMAAVGGRGWVYRGVQGLWLVWALVLILKGLDQGNRFELYRRSN